MMSNSRRSNHSQPLLTATDRKTSKYQTECEMFGYIYVQEKKRQLNTKN